MVIYRRPVEQFELVDFSISHDPNDYLHYRFAIMEDGIRKNWMYESFELSTKSVVYRGYKSYWNRCNSEKYHFDLLKRKSNFKEIINSHKNEDIIDNDNYDEYDEEELLQKKMKEMLTKS